MCFSHYPHPKVFCLLAEVRFWQVDSLVGQQKISTFFGEKGQVDVGEVSEQFLKEVEVRG